MSTTLRKHEFNSFGHIDKKEMRENCIRYMYTISPNAPNIYNGVYSARKAQKYISIKHRGVLDRHTDDLFPHRSDLDKPLVHRSATSPVHSKSLLSRSSAIDPSSLLLKRKSKAVVLDHLRPFSQLNYDFAYEVHSPLQGEAHRLATSPTMDSLDSLISPMAPRSKTATELVKGYISVCERVRKKESDEKLFKRAMGRSGLEEVMEKAEQRVKERSHKINLVEVSTIIDMSKCVLSSATSSHTGIERSRHKRTPTS
ncbi:Hypothetical protein GLP15_3567 [Giardia lamblia P15]|uniref:Uncharacterized protein n=1 Tax=Giardia intestinalis (strain P15) TaxID=658858 RepID=E1F7H6_GIAIA|nr:Hypothetical protein GLP15_3567 [Giardia lamblia P15]